MLTRAQKTSKPREGAVIDNSASSLITTIVRDLSTEEIDANEK